MTVIRRAPFHLHHFWEFVRDAADLGTAGVMSVLPLLFVVTHAEPHLNEDEIRQRWSMMRQNLHPVHQQQHEKSGHHVNTLNVTAGDHMMHKTITKYDQTVKERVESPFLFATVETANGLPITVPVQEIAHNLFRAPGEPLVAIPTMTPNQRGPLPLRAADELRPLDRYCSMNDCTTMGELSRTFGRRIQNMYHASAPGRVQDRMSASASSALYSATRELIPHGLSRLTQPPALDAGIEAFKDLVDSVNLDPDRPLRQTAERLSRTLVWDNVELIGPSNTDRRMANTLAFVHARDMFICRLSGNTLPYCRRPILSPIEEREISDIDDSQDFIDLANSTVISETAAKPYEQVDLSELNGFSVSGVAESCRLQGGCTSGSAVTPIMFDRSYTDNYFIVANQTETVHNDSEEPAIDATLADQEVRSKWGSTPAAARTWPFFFKVYDKDVKIPVRGDDHWLSQQRRHMEFNFIALVLPRYDNLTRVIESRLPFLYLVPYGKIPVTARETQADEASFDPLSSMNWNKPWLDWRFAYPAKNEHQCIGPYDFEARMCTTPIALILRPLVTEE